MKYKKAKAEVISFEGRELFMAWSAGQGVTKDNVWDFLATQGVSPSDVNGGGVDALQINQSTHTVICSYYSKCAGQQFTW